MSRKMLILASLLALLVSPVFGQVAVTSPVVTYEAPAVTYYSPTISSSTVISPPVVEYAAPVTVGPAVTTYYGPAVATPVYGQPVTVGRSAYGTVRAYVPGQPVRNTLRFALP